MPIYVLVNLLKRCHRKKSKTFRNVNNFFFLICTICKRMSHIYYNILYIIYIVITFYFITSCVLYVYKFSDYRLRDNTSIVY